MLDSTQADRTLSQSVQIYDTDCTDSAQVPDVIIFSCMFDNTQADNSLFDSTQIPDIYMYVCMLDYTVQADRTLSATAQKRLQIAMKLTAVTVHRYCV